MSCCDDLQLCKGGVSTTEDDDAQVVGDKFCGDGGCGGCGDYDEDGDDEGDLEEGNNGGIKKKKNKLTGYHRGKRHYHYNKERMGPQYLVGTGKNGRKSADVDSSSDVESIHERGDGYNVEGDEEENNSDEYGNNNYNNNNNNGTHGNEPMVFMISGCEDSQTSADVSNVNSFQLPDPKGRAGGACTSALLNGTYVMLYITYIYASYIFHHVVTKLEHFVCVCVCM